MLTIAGTGNESKSVRKLRRERKLWNDERIHTKSLGCSTCLDQKTCGGIHIEREVYDCLFNCCQEPQKCDSVCRNKPREFAQRVREIAGFHLGNVPRANRLPEQPLPLVVPVLYHGSKRQSPFAAPAVCIPLYSVIARHGGEERYKGAAGVAQAFRFEAGTPLILTGVDKDQPLERWWSLGGARLDQIRRLRDMDVKLVTSPNFSLFSDRPRWDNLHSMKRIAITHEEFLREELPAALHLNARTERDWESWTEYISERTEITHVAFEFGTGAGRVARRGWHASQLAKLARNVGRPLHLVVRAPATAILPGLATAFGKLTVLETSSFLRAVHRQRAIETASGKVRWQSSPTSSNEPLDELLSHNWSVVSRSYEFSIGRHPRLEAAA